MFALKNKVWLLHRKADGRYNKGIVVGVELFYESVGYVSEKQFFKDFVEYRYKIAYVGVVTKRACTDWVYFKDISKTKPADATN